MRYAFTLGGQTHHVVVEEHADGPRFLVDEEAFTPDVEKNGEGYRVRVGDDEFTFRIHGSTIEGPGGPLSVAIRRAKPQVLRAGRKGGAGSGAVKPPMPGKIVEVRVKEGDEVAQGDVLLVLEAMKMQNDIKSPIAGKVAKLSVAAGATVESSTILAVVEPSG